MKIFILVFAVTIAQEVFGQSCKVNEKATNKVIQCEFPFKFKGETHNKCVDYVDVKNGEKVKVVRNNVPVKPWCSTKVSGADREHVSGGNHFGDCDSTCPGGPGYKAPINVGSILFQKNSTTEKIEADKKAASTFENCDCQCDSYKWTNGNKILGNCASPDKNGALFCYVSGRAAKACRDVQQSSSVKDNNGRAKFYSYEACTTPPRHRCNQPGIRNPAALGPSSYGNCDCQCDSYTWTGNGNVIKGNCQSRDRKGAKFCYISGRATRACRDIQQSTFLKDNNGRFRYYSYEACTTTARNLCNQFLGDGDIVSLQGALAFNTLGPLIKAGTRSPGTNSSETEQ